AADSRNLGPEVDRAQPQRAKAPPQHFRQAAPGHRFLAHVLSPSEGTGFPSQTREGGGRFTGRAWLTGAARTSATGLNRAAPAPRRARPGPTRPAAPGIATLMFRRPYRAARWGGPFSLDTLLLVEVLPTATDQTRPSGQALLNC